MNDLPVLYSFRRCPYAIRARMAVAAAGIEVTIREVLLKDKPPALIAASAKDQVFAIRKFVMKVRSNLVMVVVQSIAFAKDPVGYCETFNPCPGEPPTEHYPLTDGLSFSNYLVPIHGAPLPDAMSEVAPLALIAPASALALIASRPVP